MARGKWNTLHASRRAAGRLILDSLGAENDVVSMGGLWFRDRCDTLFS